MSEPGFPCPRCGAARACKHRSPLEPVAPPRRRQEIDTLRASEPAASREPDARPGGVDSSELLAEVEAFLERTGMKATRFGEESTSRAALVGLLRKGRPVKLATVEKVRAFMASR